MTQPSNPDPESFALKAAQSLAEADSKLRASLVGFDAAAVFSSYALYRMAAAHSDRPAKHPRPAPVAVELAAWSMASA